MHEGAIHEAKRGNLTRVKEGGEGAVPLYSWLHFSLTMTDVPIRLFKKGLGFTAARLCEREG